MRVAIIAAPHYPVPPPLYGGTERVIAHLVRGLVEAGQEPVLFAPGDSTAECELVPTCDEAIGFASHRRDLPAHDALRNEIEKRTNEELRRHSGGIDLMHSHGFDLIDFEDFPNLTTLHGAIGLNQLAIGGLLASRGGPGGDSG